MIQPDGFFGSVVAAESIRGMKVLLNGPAGCRNRFMVLMRQLMRDGDYDDEKYSIPYFKGQSRVPCTYTDEEDFINGGYAKIADALRVIGPVCDDMVAIIDSPGAALIGDDHSKAIADAGMTGRAFTLGSFLMSKPYEHSYDLTLVSVMEHLKPEKGDVIPKSVNIIGYPVTDKDWRHGLEWMTDVLGSMGITVIAAIGAGASVDEIRDSVRAKRNILVYPEFGSMLSEYMSKEYGIPTISTGAPIGLKGCRDWILSIASEMDVDPNVALRRIDDAEREIVSAIRSDKARAKNLQGMTFAVECIPSMALPLTMWLIDYLGMVPSSVRFTASDDDSEKRLREYLGTMGLESVIGAPMLGYTDVVLTNGHDALHMIETRRCGIGIDIAFPTPEEIHIRPDPLIGPVGAMSIVEKILNGI